MLVGICKEIFPGERRVALIPDVVPGLTDQRLAVLAEHCAGCQAGIADSAFETKVGAVRTASALELRRFSEAFRPGLRGNAACG